MILTYHGKDFIKAQSGDTIMAINPIGKSSKYKTTKFGADVALVSKNDEDHNGIEEVTFGTKQPFVVLGAGEYEVKGIFIKGFLSDANQKINTIYTAQFDGMNLCFLGALTSPLLPEEAVESLVDIDILFVPVGENPAAAYKLAVSLEPKLIIPLGEEAEIKKFIKEAGESSPEKTDKLTLKKKDLEGKEGDIVLLSN